MNLDHVIASVFMVAGLIGALLWLTGWVDEDEGDDRSSNVDEHGIDRTPGQEPREVGLP